MATKKCKGSKVLKNNPSTQRNDRDIFETFEDYAV
jgi:hypothetical protein